MHTSAITKADFVLRGVRIRVHAGGIHRQIEHIGRKAAVEQDVAVGVLRGVRQGPVADAATIDEPELLVRLAAVIRGQRDPALQRDAIGLVFEMDRLLGKRVPAQFGEARQLLFAAGGGRQTQHRPPIVRQRKRNARSR